VENIYNSRWQIYSGQ